MAGLFPETGYGPSPNYQINTLESYSVKIQFFVDVDSAYVPTALTDIKTTLYQGTHELSFNQTSTGSDCSGIYDSLYLRLRDAEMSLAFSSYNVGSHSEIDTKCLGTCTKSNAKLSNLNWKFDTSINPYPDPDDDKDNDTNELIVTEEAS